MTGGVGKNGKVVSDKFYDIKALPDGSVICAGLSRDSVLLRDQMILVKIDQSGKLIWKKLYNNKYHQYANSVAIARNGDFLVGGGSSGAPVILRTDSAGNTKWYYDTIKDEQRLLESATVNSLRETSRGTIICAAGDEYPENDGLSFDNYAAYFELDSAGQIIHKGQWFMPDYYKIGGFCIDEGANGNCLLSGYQSVLYIESTGNLIWQKTYSYMLDGVGSMVANVMRARVLRDNRPMVLGQIHEGNCWTSYQKLYYDAWWAPFGYGTGSTTARDTAGWQRGDDIVYDFTQLTNGNIVIIGIKYFNYSTDGGIWTIVTDSTGNRTLWEKQTKIPYKTSDGRSILPVSVCATPDSGFSISGRYYCASEYGGSNGFVTHYVPKNPLVVSSRSGISRRSPGVSAAIIGSKFVIYCDDIQQYPGISIYNAAGRMIAGSLNNEIRKTGNSFEWDFSKVCKGVYFYSISFDGHFITGNLIAGLN
jgi:hypothetical protein